MDNDSSLGAPSGEELRRALEGLQSVLRAVLERMVFADEHPSLTDDYVLTMETSNAPLLQLLDSLSFEKPSPQETFWKFPETWTAVDLVKRIDFINDVLEADLPNVDPEKLKEVLRLSQEEKKSLDDIIWDMYYGGGSGTQESGTGTQESGTGTQESGTGTQESGTRTQESGTGTQESGTGTQESGTGTQESGTGTQESGERAGPSGESQAGPSSCGTFSSDVPVEERRPKKGKLKVKRLIIELESDEDSISSAKRNCTSIEGEIDNGSEFVEKSCDGNENHNSDISRMDKESNLPREGSTQVENHSCPSSQESEDIIEASQESRPSFFNRTYLRYAGMLSMFSSAMIASSQENCDLPENSSVPSSSSSSSGPLVSSVDVLPLDSFSEMSNLLRSTSANSIPETIIVSSQESCTSEITSRKTNPDGDDVIVLESDSSESDIFIED